MDISNLTAVPYYWDPAQSKYVYDDAKCTLGFNVRAAQSDYFMTAALRNFAGNKRITGTPRFRLPQASSVGIIVINPRWGEVRVSFRIALRSRTTTLHTADVISASRYGIASSRTMGPQAGGKRQLALKHQQWYAGGSVDPGMSTDKHMMLANLDTNRYSGKIISQMASRRRTCAGRQSSNLLLVAEVMIWETSLAFKPVQGK